MKNKRILIVEVNWLGDVLFSTAAIRALRKSYPDSFIGCLVHKRCKEVLAANPYINEIIILDEDGEHKGFLGKIKLINQLKAGQFDTAYLFHRSFTRTLICYLSGIKNRIGYYTPKRSFLLTESVNPPKGIVHRAAYYYYLITRSIPSDNDSLGCDFFIEESDTSYVNNILKERNINMSNRIVVMHPAGNWLPKRWPKENFAKLADILIEKFSAVVIFSGTQKDKGLIGNILGLMKNRANDLSAELSLKQLGALFKRADLVISADSGPLHISAALNRPTVALFGPTSKDITGPLAKEDIALLQREVDCIIPCYKENCLDNRCMKEITVDDVINSIEERKWLT